MQIIYNGISMSVMQETWEYRVESVYDDTKTDYLYSRHTMACRSMINGQADVFSGYSRPVNGELRWFRNGPAITYTPYGSGEVGTGVGVGIRDSKISDPVTPSFSSSTGAAPTVGQGVGIDRASKPGMVEVVLHPNQPAFTHQVIRQRLSYPRGKLFLVSPVSEPIGAQEPIVLLPVILESPGPNLDCDCRNGPFPTVFSVDKVYGNDQTFVVTFGLETYVNESLRNGISTSGPLLSNRFAQTASIDERSYTTIHTQGRAIFRTDYLYFQDLSPDQLRAILMLKIPFGFKREEIEVTGTPDATGVDYSFVDRQLPIQFPAGPYAKAQKIAAVHRQVVVNNQDILGGALAATERVLGIAANANIAKSPKPRRRAVDPPAASGSALGGTTPAP